MQLGRVLATVTRNDIQGAPAGDLALLSMKIRPLAAEGGDLKIFSIDPIASDGARPTVDLPAPFHVKSATATQ